ncbi:MAG: hypothetical protein NC213_02350 [Acetobacter sp.]|nr:hypothetical protein [Bacteroides sp.]MCM1340562.1 hypothetical protein [Acetobacter sp.]MCM1433302.1 hypothetical protein [Clostridiales bacterium]
MPKISATNNKSLFLKFTLKSILISYLFVALLSVIASYVILKLDLDLSCLNYTSIAVCVVSAFATPLFTNSDFKNNFLLLSILSILPLILFSIINSIINRNSFIFTLIKVALEIAMAVFSAIIKTIRKRR